MNRVDASASFILPPSSLSFYSLDGPADVLNRAVLNGQLDRRFPVKPAPQRRSQQLRQGDFHLAQLHAVPIRLLDRRHGRYYTKLHYVAQITFVPLEKIPEDVVWGVQRPAVAGEDWRQRSHSSTTTFLTTEREEYVYPTSPKSSASP